MKYKSRLRVELMWHLHGTISVSLQHTSPQDTVLCLVLLYHVTALNTMMSSLGCDIIMLSPILLFYIRYNHVRLLRLWSYTLFCIVRPALQLTIQIHFWSCWSKVKQIKQFWPCDIRYILWWYINSNLLLVLDNGLILLATKGKLNVD